MTVELTKEDIIRLILKTNPTEGFYSSLLELELGNVVEGKWRWTDDWKKLKRLVKRFSEDDIYRLYRLITGYEDSFHFD